MRAFLSFLLFSRRTVKLFEDIFFLVSLKTFSHEKIWTPFNEIDHMGRIRKLFGASNLMRASVLCDALWLSESLKELFVSFLFAILRANWHAGNTLKPMELYIKLSLPLSLSLSLWKLANDIPGTCLRYKDSCAQNSRHKYYS